MFIYVLVIQHVSLQEVRIRPYTKSMNVTNDLTSAAEHPQVKPHRKLTSNISNHETHILKINKEVYETIRDIIDFIPTFMKFSPDEAYPFNTNPKLYVDHSEKTFADRHHLHEHQDITFVFSTSHR